MTKFKQGDAVKCTDTRGVINLNWSDEYTVVSCNTKYVTIKVGYRYGDVYGSPSTFSVDRFKLVGNEPNAEDYNDMLRDYFFRYSAGGYNDNGGLMSIERCKSKLDFIIKDAARNATSMAKEEAKRESREAAKERVKEGRVLVHNWAKEAYSTILWLYRRLPRGYESPPHIESAIKNLAKALGEDAQEFIDERKGMK